MHKENEQHRKQEKPHKSSLEELHKAYYATKRRKSLSDDDYFDDDDVDCCID
jgi:hypothetical protein